MVTTQAPLDKIPLFVKAGSIIPLGKMMQYTSEKSADTLDILIYKGADGSFTLYEDENDGYNYEKGLYTEITFIWNDAKKVLTISDRHGSFPGMLKERIFNIIIISEGKGAGIEIEKPDQLISYTGKKTSMKF
jgi:alpha-D-xyloside xylohydrolase